jgi:hypothetical protein
MHLSATAPITSPSPQALCQPDLPNPSEPSDLPSILPSILANPNILHLLKSYQLLPHLLRELVIDRAIAPFASTPEEAALICEHWFAQQQVSPAQQSEWLQEKGLTLEEAMAPLKRGIRIEKFKQATWGHKIESYFLQRKAQLDQVIYSMIQHSDSGLITELYFRLQAGEASFAELASDYSQGLAGKTKGIMGPVELGDLHANLAVPFQHQPQQIVKTCIGDWYILAQVEVKIPAQLDATLRQRLLNQLYVEWLEQEVDQLRWAA